MKKGVLILLGMFMMVSTVEAENGNELPNRFGINYSYNNAVNFIERGVEFYIFTNGEFDFNTNYNTYNRVRIDRDFRGRIRSVGNSFINYDRFGNVTRIGNVFMSYYGGRLTNVGNLRVNYDRWGNPIFYGNVRSNFYHYNGVRFNLNIGDVCDYNDSYFSHRDFRRNYAQIREDNNFYYYRANTNARIGKRSQILRRRKPASFNSKRKFTTNRRNNSYRKPGKLNSKRTVTTKKRGNNIYRKSSVTTKRKSRLDTRRNKNSYKKPASVNTRRSNSRKTHNTTKTSIKRIKKSKVINRTKNERKRRS